MINEPPNLATDQKLAPTRRFGRRPARADVLVGVLLVATMIFGAYLRFVGQNWDDFTHLHPDERFLTGVAQSIGGPVLQVGDKDDASKQQHMADCMARYPDTNGVGGFFDAECSTLYPPNVGYPLYVYGELPLFLTRLGGELAAAVTHDQNWLGYNGIHFAGRTMSALSELITILFVFLIGRRLYGRWVGLLAAFLYCCSVLPIQLAHFWTADAFTNMPLAIAFWFAARTLDEARWYDFVGFGAMFGAALAGRINTLPLAGVIILAALIYCLPALDLTIPGMERRRLLGRAARGLVFAAIATFVVFRFTSPHAFTGPGVLGLKPYAPFFDQIREAQYETSGLFDIPPNYQWVNRAPYLFAWRNIVEWGMGIPLGLIAWGGWIYAVFQILRARRLWTRHAILVAWVLVYFGYLGRNWVATMRYFMPLYPVLAILGAWLMVELVKRATRAFREHPGTVRRLAQAVAIAILVFVTGFTALWGFGFSRIYTRLLTRVDASQWILRNLPSAVSLNLTMDDGRLLLFNLPYGGTAGGDPNALTIQRKSPASGTVASITLPHALAANSTGGRTTLFIQITDTASGQQVGTGKLAADFTPHQTSQFGEAYTLKLDAPARFEENQQYTFRLYTDGDAVQLTGTVIATEGAWDDPIPWKVCPIPASMDLTPDTPSGVNGPTCEGIDGFGEGLYKGYELYMVAEDTDQKRDIIQTGLDAADYITISSNRFYDSLPRNPARFPMTTRFYQDLFAGRAGFDVFKTFTSYITIGPIQVPDMVLPTDNAPDWMKEQYQSEEAFTVYDHPVVFLLKKQPGYTPQIVRSILRGTNIADQSVLPVGSYDSTITAGKVNWTSFNASAAPTGFMLTPEQLQIQRTGGTWSELFNRNSPINSSPLASVLIWYGTLLILGWITFPLLFAILPGLPDRGYPIAKFAGLLIVSWIVWTGGTLQFLIWSSPGILLTMVGLAAASLFFALRNRAALAEFLRTRRRYILVVEALSLALFIGFLLVRLGNPDLWAQVLGGEKPMDFSYFNAVLRSTIFPPYDPWYSGGYLNYYYFGYVIVGTPVKLLGMMPQIAYNLILPMLFSMTGIGAFSVAYNVVASRLATPHAEGSAEPEAPFVERRRWALHAPPGSAYIAGVAAMAMCVILGNLDTPRIIGTGILNAGGYVAQPLSDDAYINAVNDFIQANGRSPTPEEDAKIHEQTDNPNLFTSLQQSVTDFQRMLGAFGSGLNSVMNTGYLPVGADRWFWGPSRVLGELPNASSEITEMPYFTFVYADLHAHMIAMPLQLLALAWLLSEVLIAGVVRRPRTLAILATIFGGMVVGLLFPTNTWDWVTYMILAMAGLTFASWLRARSAHTAPQGIFAGSGSLFDWLLGRLTRSSVLEWLGYVAGFFAAQQIAGLPFRSYFATGYSSASPFLGQKSPLWAYLDIHGLFIFVMLTLLIWQTTRLLRRTYVRDMLRHPRAIMIILGSILIILLATLAFTTLNLQRNLFIFDPPYPAAIVILPMIGWATILFFTADQSREMRIVLALVILALALTMGAEMVTLANDSGRQNTIFKLYMQVWVLFSVIGGVGVAWLIRASERWGALLRSPWLAALTLLLAVAGLFPLMSTQGKIAMRMAPQAPHVLDGLQYMNYAVYTEGDKQVPLKDELDVITWLQDNIKGSPVVLEAQEPEYRLGNRIAMTTGLPTVLGYRYHQTQQRSLDPLPQLVNGRMANVAGLYNTPDIDVAREMLRQFEVEYIVVAGLERAIYKPEGLAKFDLMVNQGLLEVVYNKNNNRVYHVLPPVMQWQEASEGATSP